MRIVVLCDINDLPLCSMLRVRCGMARAAPTQTDGFLLVDRRAPHTLYPHKKIQTGRFFVLSNGGGHIREVEMAMTAGIRGEWVAYYDGRTEWARSRVLRPAEMPLWLDRGELVDYPPIDGPRLPSCYADEPSRWADDGGRA